MHNFKKDVSKQTKDIASLERRIASLSGSENAADIAERKRLEAQLYESKESLNDTYYNHAKDAQSAALDEEAQAFSDAKEKYIEELEATLDNTELLIQESMLAVLFNADVVYNQLAGEGGIADTYGVTLSNELAEPWKIASEQAKKWKTDVGVYVGECTPFVVALSEEIKKKLGENGAWKNAEKAAKDYSDFINGDDLKNNMDSSISKLCTSIQSIVDKWNNVKTAADNAYDAQYRANNVGGKLQNDNGGGEDTNGSQLADDQEKTPKEYFCNVTLDASANLGSGAKLIGGTATETTKDAAFESAKKKVQNQVLLLAIENGMTYSEARRHWEGTWSRKLNATYTPKYAKGTTGTTKDEWAITDEPWLGDELTMYATPQGTLSYMRAGSTVVPAEITKNLVEWGKINPNMANMSGVGTNLNMISNAVNKPELNLNVENFLRCDNVSQDSMPELKKFVNEQMNNLMKRMNYALKGVGSR